MLKDYELLNIATSVGYSMLEHGAEIYRVEESISRICFAYSGRKAEVFAIPASIVVTLTQPDGQFITKTKRIYGRDTDLDKIDRLNSLSRTICRDTPEPQEVEHALQDIQNSPTYPVGWQTFAGGVASFFFALFFGGNLWDGVCAFGVGILLKLLVLGLNRLKSNLFFVHLAGSFMTALLALLVVQWGWAAHMDRIIIGVLMNLVPGLALTNAVRDFMAGDVMAGMTKLSEAMLVAISIALGVAVVLTFLQPLWGGSL